MLAFSVMFAVLLEINGSDDDHDDDDDGGGGGGGGGGNDDGDGDGDGDDTCKPTVLENVIATFTLIFRVSLAVPT